MWEEWDGTSIALLLNSPSCGCQWENSTQKMGQESLSAEVSAVKLCPSAFILSSPLGHPLIPTRTPGVLGDFRRGNLQRSFVTHRPPFTSTFTLSQNSQADLFPWVSKAHSVPEGHFVIAWNWNAKRLQMLLETRGWDSPGGDGEPLCPEGGWAGTDRMPAWTCTKQSTCCQNLQHLPYPWAASQKAEGKEGAQLSAPPLLGCFRTPRERDTKDTTSGHRQCLCLYQCS